MNWQYAATLDHAHGMTQEEVAAKYGCHRSRIGQIVTKVRAAVGMTREKNPAIVGNALARRHRRIEENSPECFYWVELRHNRTKGNWE